LEQIIFEIFNISENNIISVELAKVLMYEEEIARLKKYIIGGLRYINLQVVQKSLVDTYCCF
jgi:hypothetical protein